jgi:hypothetical protein
MVFMKEVFMKKTLIFIAGAALLAVALLCMSCDEPPTEEMNRALEALSRAENDTDAVNYAGNILTRARDALSKMQEESSLKRFDSAKLFATDVVSLAERAITEGQAGAARAREEASNFLEGIRPSIAETQTALNEAQNHDLDLDYDSLTAALNAARTTFDSAQSSLGSGNFPEAIQKGQMVRSVLSDINTAISEGVQIVLVKK